MIIHKTTTLALTESEIETLQKTTAILYNILAELEFKDNIEINNNEYNYDDINDAYLLLTDLCKQDKYPIILNTLS